MKISTRARYGTRLMFQLALDYGKGFILLKDIAKKEYLSEKYLSLIVIPLRAQGLLTSARGAKGGYALARPPAKISVKDIVVALDGEISVSACVRDSKKCRRFSGCVTREIWRTLDDKIEETLQSISLEDLVDIHKRRGSSPVIYEI